jgi:hypothetical protein
MPESMQQPSEEDFAKLGIELAKLLAGYHPDVQGAAIANMVIVWLDRYRPEGRDRLFETFIKTVRATIEAKAKEDAARVGH